MRGPVRRRGCVFGLLIGRKGRVAGLGGDEAVAGAEQAALRRRPARRHRHHLHTHVPPAAPRVLVGDLRRTAPAEILRRNGAQ